MKDNNYICITDADGVTRYFQPTDLAAQLVHTELSGGNPAMKAAARSLAQRVVEMRRCQKNYMAARSSDEANRNRLLEQAKKAEAGVDALVLIFLQTIEKL